MWCFNVQFNTPTQSSEVNTEMVMNQPDSVSFNFQLSQDLLSISCYQA